MLNPMVDIQFDEQQFEQPRAAAGKPSWLSGLVIKSGLAKDEASAQRALLIILVLAIILIVVIFMMGSGGSAPTAAKLPPPGNAP